MPITLLLYPSILMKIIVLRVSKRKLAKKKEQKKQGVILISRNSFTQLFNIQMTKFKYSWILVKLLEMVDNSQKN